MYEQPNFFHHVSKFQDVPMLLPYGIFIAKMVFTRQDKDEINTLLADQLNDFKNKVIEKIKSNIS